LIVAIVVQTKELAQSVVASVVAGVGVTFIFSIAIWGAVRFVDLNRNERPVAAAAAGVVGALALAVTLAAVAIGIIVMTKK
jgi:predicted permease